MLRECPLCDELVVLVDGPDRCEECGTMVYLDDDWHAADQEIHEVDTDG